MADVQKVCGYPEKNKTCPQERRTGLKILRLACNIIE
jgi:hypothetical protein